MTMQILAILALLIWAGATMVLLGLPRRTPHDALSVGKYFALGLLVAAAIFIVTGALLALLTIAMGAQPWAL